MAAIWPCGTELLAWDKSKTTSHCEAEGDAIQKMPPTGTDCFVGLMAPPRNEGMCTGVFRSHTGRVQVSNLPAQSSTGPVQCQRGGLKPPLPCVSTTVSRTCPAAFRIRSGVIGWWDQRTSNGERVRLIAFITTAGAPARPRFAAPLAPQPRNHPRGVSHGQPR